MNHPLTACSRCGGSKLELGRMQSLGEIVFRPDNIKLFSMKSGLRVDVEVCVDCGNVQMSVDTNQLAKLTGRA